MDDRIRVAFFQPHLDAGGVERVVLNLLRHLDRKSFRPLLILGRREGRLLSMVPDDVTVFDLQGRPMSRAVPRLIECLATSGARVACAGTNATNIGLLLAAALMRRAPAVIVGEHTPPRIYKQQAKWSAFRRLAMRLLYPRAACITVPLAEIGEELKDLLRVSDLKVRALDNPVLERAALTDCSPRAQLPDFCQGVPILVAAGRLVHLKGFDILIEAFARLAERWPEGRLVILGEGPERARLTALVEDRGLTSRVFLPGMVDNPMDYFHRAEAVVMTSRYDAAPNVLVEAMAAGAPVVAVDCPQGPRSILLDGEAGLLVPPEDPGAVADALGRVLHEPELAARLRRRGRERAQDFTVERALPRYEALFREVAAA